MVKIGEIRVFKHFDLTWNEPGGGWVGGGGRRREGEEVEVEEEEVVVDEKVDYMVNSPFTSHPDNNNNRWSHKNPVTQISYPHLRRSKRLSWRSERRTEWRCVSVWVSRRSANPPAASSRHHLAARKARKPVLPMNSSCRRIKNTVLGQ